MTDLRNMPRYIRNTDAFGWQGADEPKGPWRSITPPQTGTPWQSTTLTMDDLRQASADVSGVEVLSPAAQAVWDAAWQLSPVNCKSHEDRRRQQIAAALRAAVLHAQPKDRIEDIDYVHQHYVDGWEDALGVVLAIADELEKKSAS